MHRAREAGKGIGRPQKTVDKDKLITLLAENHSKTRIARTLGLSKATLYKKLKELS
jgi:putative DNA-invertase from lambdoid prophage Rac